MKPEVNRKVGWAEGLVPFWESCKLWFGEGRTTGVFPGSLVNYNTLEIGVAD